jgi:hypothetical protein
MTCASGKRTHFKGVGTAFRQYGLDFGGLYWLPRC